MVFKFPDSLADLARAGAVGRGADGLAARSTRVVATGIEALDAALPGGGLPCGHVTELAGPASCGKLGLAARILARALAAGERAALVDAAGAFYPLSPALVRALARLLVCRVPTSVDAVGAAELLAAGGMDLVVVDLARARAPVGGAFRTALTRLAAAARDRDVAVVAITEPPAGAEGLLGSAAALRVAVSAAPTRVADGRIESRVRLARSRVGHGRARMR